MRRSASFRGLLLARKKIARRHCKQGECAQRAETGRSERDAITGVERRAKISIEGQLEVS